MTLFHYGRTCRIAGALVLMCLGLPETVAAQWVDLGFGGGITSYRGDIQVPMSGFKPGAYGAIHAKYNFTPHWGVKVQVGQGQVSAADSVSGDPKQIQRNLSFTSSIIEARLGVEFNFWPYVPGSLKRRSAPCSLWGPKARVWVTKPVWRIWVWKPSDTP